MENSIKKKQTFLFQHFAGCWTLSNIFPLWMFAVSLVIPRRMIGNYCNSLQISTITPFVHIKTPMGLNCLTFCFLPMSGGGTNRGHFPTAFYWATIQRQCCLHTVLILWLALKLLCDSFYDYVYIVQTFSWSDFGAFPQNEDNDEGWRRAANKFYICFWSNHSSLAPIGPHCTTQTIQTA